MGNYRPFLQGPLPVANYTRIIIPGRFWTRPPSTKSTRMASSATPLHDSLIIPDAHAHAIKWYLNYQQDGITTLTLIVNSSYAGINNTMIQCRTLTGVYSQIATFNNCWYDSGEILSTYQVNSTTFSEAVMTLPLNETYHIICMQFNFTITPEHQDIAGQSRYVEGGYYARKYY